MKEIKENIKLNSEGENLIESPFSIGQKSDTKLYN
jgi:hypothetical protein